MKTQTIDGIYVASSEDIPQEELRVYVSRMREAYLLMKSMTVESDGNFVNIHIHIASRPFERLRRVTLNEET
ncbi:MAG: hypothetical protein J6Y20_07200 [Lachnospiraceae bacterium]|nr:hypothetical protein [Lachnospiraceae bacterium]